MRAASELAEAPIGQPVVLLGLRRRAGAHGPLPAAEQLRLRFQPKPAEVQLVDARRGTLVLSKPTGRRGVAAALAALQEAGLVACRLMGVQLVETVEVGNEGDVGADDEEDEEERAEQEEVAALLEVELLEPIFEGQEGDESGAHVAALVDHFSELREALHILEEEEGEQEEGGGQGSDSSLPFAAAMRAGWRWHASAAAKGSEAEQQEGAQVAASDVGGVDEEGGNMRDRIFTMVLPSDWQLEAAEPPGLACTLFRYQRRCLAWLKWRESLVNGGSSGAQDIAGTACTVGTSECEPTTAEAAAAAGVADAALPDVRSCKAVLPSSSLRWPPLVLPSGLQAYYDPLSGCIRRQPVRPPLPEVPGGLLCDEMGLGKTVEMLALFLANPPPQGLQQHQQQHQQAQPSSKAAGTGAPPSNGQEQTGSEGGAAELAPSPVANAAAAGTAAAVGSSPPGSGGAASQATTFPGRQPGVNGSSNGCPPPQGATLVVCPPALLQQWQAELANHAHGCLVVEIYDGLRGLQVAVEGLEPARKRQKPAQREMDLYARLLAGEEVEASFDAEAEAASAIRRLVAADVVLTSFDVLRAEVNFVPNSRTFRRPKKYAVPHCPLLQVHWWRLVIDEAQMVGPLSAAGTMCERMHAVHRWCVTGTPMGAHRNELTDIHALLHTLQHQPLADATTWRRLVAEPIASGGILAARQAWELLGRVLRPLMWRNTKGVVAQEFHLPPRSLRPTWLHFQPGERAFYEQVVEKTKAAREELLTFRRAQEYGSDQEEEADQGEEAEAEAGGQGEGEIVDLTVGNGGAEGAGTEGGGNEDAEWASPSRPRRSSRARASSSRLSRAGKASGSKASASGGKVKGKSPALAARVRQRRRDKQGERLESAAVENVTQLRLACVHPQLTKVWKEMQAEGQIGVSGATLSMEEIMQRLVETAQHDLQEAERGLCAHLNTLAMRLVVKAAEGKEAPAGGSGKGGEMSGQGREKHPGSPSTAAAAAAAAGQREEDEGTAGSPRPAKRARKSRGGYDAMGAVALEGQAVHLLEQSFRVAEKGIAALDVTMASLKSMPDIEGGTSTVNAWKRVQINTASQLSKLYAAAGRGEEAGKMDVDAQEKMSYLRAQAHMELTSAQQRLEQLQQQADSARHAFTLHHAQATDRGFAGWGVTSNAASWLAGLEGSYGEAQELEQQELEAQEGIVKAMLGKRVTAALDDVEKGLHGELTVLDRYVSEQHSAAGFRRLAREQNAWDVAAAAAAAAATGSGGGGGGNAAGGGSDGKNGGASGSVGGGSGAAAGETAVVNGGVRVLWDVLKLLPDFRRKTLQVQHVAVFSKVMVEEGEKRAAEAARKKEEAQKAAAAAAGVSAPMVDAEVVKLEAGGTAAAAAAGTIAAAAPVGKEAQAAGSQPGQDVQQPAGEERAVEASQQQQQQAAVGAELSAVLSAVHEGRDFVSSGCWQGRVKGYVFKTGGSGLGYYKDVPPAVEATLGQLAFVAAAVGRALQEHQRRLAKAAGPEARLFSSLSLDAVEAKLESVKQQIQLVRTLKEQHVAERTLALKAALQADLDAELAAAAELPPLPGGGTADRLAKEVEALKEQAQALLHRKRFMSSRVSEARQLQPGGATGGGAGAGAEAGAGASQQQPQQPQQEGQRQQPQQQQQQDGLEEQQQQQQQDGPEEQQAQQGTKQQHGISQAQPSLGSSAPFAATAAAGEAGAAEARATAAMSSDEAGPSTAGAGAGVTGPGAASMDVDPASGMECPVCLTVVPAGGDINVFSGCGHAFCKDCSAKLVLHQGVCAVCRQKVTRTQVYRVAAGGARASGACDPEFEALGKIQPQGEWSVKVEALLRRLLHLATTCPSEKALVFSQFPDALKLVALALQTNGIRFVQLLGGRQAARKAVASFREDEEVRVFLLSHRAGAAGLTLVRASHVFLLEPALDPAIEQQAVARVHRIGQQRPVVVTRLLVRDSIEQGVLARQEAKHALFAGADGAAEDTAELATTVEAPVRAENLGEEDLQGLLEGM